MIVERLLRHCFDLAGVTLVVLMLVTVVDIAARHLGLFTVRGIIEISTMAVVMIGFLALPYSFVLGGHIVVDLATLYFPPNVNRAIDKAWICIRRYDARTGGLRACVTPSIQGVSG
jgi:TRAP-type C4-dicarboxylate transport system permease small subunit